METHLEQKKTLYEDKIKVRPNTHTHFCLWHISMMFSRVVTFIVEFTQDWYTLVLVIHFIATDSLFILGLDETFKGLILKVLSVRLSGVKTQCLCFVGFRDSNEGWFGWKGVARVQAEHVWGGISRAGKSDQRPDSGNMSFSFFWETIIFNWEKLHSLTPAVNLLI